MTDLVDNVAYIIFSIDYFKDIKNELHNAISDINDVIKTADFSMKQCLDHVQDDLFMVTSITKADIIIILSTPDITSDPHCKKQLQITEALSKPTLTITFNNPSDQHMNI